MTSAAWVALGATIASLFWAFWSWRRAEFRIRAHENTKLMIAIEAKLSEIPSALRFHGVTETKIEATGLSVKEFIYLVGSFSSGQTFYEFENQDPGTPFPQDNYRGIMCSHQDVAMAWPLLRNFLDDTSYRKRLETSIQRYATKSNPPKADSSAA